MVDLTTEYLGLKLKNPFIAGSCSMTSSVDDIIQLEKNSAAAVVLKSIFEEEILRELNGSIDIKDKKSRKSDEYRKSLIKDKQPLQLFFNKQVIDKYIYLDMMKYKVKEILFVATLYDAFILEYEDNFFEQSMGEIYQYSLFSLPRITGVTSPKEALELLEVAHFDLVILMVGIDKEVPVALSKEIKQKQPSSWFLPPCIPMMPGYILTQSIIKLKKNEWP